MFKWILLAAIAYFIYRFYIAPKKSGPAQELRDEFSVPNRKKSDPEPQATPETEYTDYEEID